MAVTTSQQITRYYSQFETIEVTFTREVIQALSMNAKQVFLKCLGNQWPCIIYSSSMSGAKVITTLQPSLKGALAKSKNVLSLRFSFIQHDKADPLAFFVGAKVAGISPYGDPAKGLSFLNLVFTQRPPDDLIERLGDILAAGINSKKRRDERIIMSPDTQKKLGIDGKGTRILVDSVPRKGLLRDISFGGAKLIMPGVPQFLVNRSARLSMSFEDPRETISIDGKVIRFESVEGRNDIAAFAIEFNEESVPIGYKMRLSEYLRGVKPAPAPSKKDNG